jgi:hypothetical protein
MPSATYTVTREQLVRLSTLRLRAAAAAEEARVVDESVAEFIAEIVGPFESDQAEDAFWLQFNADTDQLDPVLHDV